MREPDPYTNRPTHLRIFSEHALDPNGWSEWFLDGADDEGNYTESCWSYDTFAEAVEALFEFVQNQHRYTDVRFKFRPGRRGTLRNTHHTQEATA